MKKALKIFLSIILSMIVFVISAVWYLYFSTTVRNRLGDYESRTTNFTAYSDLHPTDVLPKLDDLPEYVDISYQYRLKRMFLWSAETLRLVVTYDKETYEEEKKKLEDKNYLDHVVKAEYSDESLNRFLIPEFEFSVNSYNFRILESEDYPHTIGFIATSDEKNSIAYLYFYDYYLDFIASMEPFIKDYFRYKW